MKEIDLATWPRKEHFEFFQKIACPQFSICTTIDVTEAMGTSENSSIQLFNILLYNICITANSIPEFKQRIRNNSVIEHNVIHPVFTFLPKTELFVFCDADFHPTFSMFNSNLFGATKRALRSGKLNSKALERDDILFVSALPWINFTQVNHQISLMPNDTVPKFSVGKLFKDGSNAKMPIAIFLHHGLADGVHAGKFLDLLQENLNDSINISSAC